MRQAAQRMLLPLLVSFSLSGFGVLLMHFLRKKKIDRKKEIEKSKNFKPSLDNSRLGPYFKEYKVNNRLIPAIVGRGGRELIRIESTTNTRIIFKEENDCNTGDRIVVIAGEPDDVELAIKEIDAIVKAEPIIDVYEYMVPVRTIKKLYKHNGKLLKKMQGSTFAKIIFDESKITSEMDNGVLKKVTIKGREQHIQQVLAELEKQIRFDEAEELQAEKNTVNRVPRIKPPNCVSPDEFPYESDISYESWVMKDILKEKDIEKPYNVFVCSVENPRRFHIQVIGEKNAKLDALIKDMTFYYKDEHNRNNHILKKFDPKKIVAAKFTDDKWYRAQIICSVDPKYIDLYFCDFGDTAKINVNDVYDLSTEFLRLRWQAQETSLYGVMPIGDSWSEEAIQTFSVLCAEGQWEPRIAVNRAWQERQLDQESAVPHGREGNPIPVIELFEKRGEQFISINKELISRKLAVQDEKAWNEPRPTPSLGRENGEAPTSRKLAKDDATSSDKSPAFDFPSWKEDQGIGPDSSMIADDENGANLDSEVEKKEKEASPSKSIENGVATKEKKAKVSAETGEGENVRMHEQSIKTASPAESQKNDSRNFIENERATPSSNGNTFLKDTKKVTYSNPFKKENKLPINILPAGCETDSEDENGFDMY